MQHNGETPEGSIDVIPGKDTAKWISGYNLGVVLEECQVKFL